MEPTLVKITGYTKYIDIRTITRQRFRIIAISRRDVLHLQSRQEVISQDGDNFAVMRKDEKTDTLKITFFWLACCGDQLRGNRQEIRLPLEAVMAYAKAEPSGEELRFLSTTEDVRYPKLVFRGRRLHEVAENKLVRRKLSKFLRSHFRWLGATEIVLYDDSLPYSFYFQEMCGEHKGISGGVILHGQEDMMKAQYSIHT